MILQNQNRMKFLQKSWDAFGLKLIVKSKPTPKEKEMAKNYKRISEIVRDKILKEYHERCKLKHSLAFFRWRVHYKKHFYIDKKFDIQTFFRIRREEFYEVEEKLFKEDFVRKVEITPEKSPAKGKGTKKGSPQKKPAIEIQEQDLFPVQP